MNLSYRWYIVALALSGLTLGFLFLFCSRIVSSWSIYNDSWTTSLRRTDTAHITCFSIDRFRSSSWCSDDTVLRLELVLVDANALLEESFSFNELWDPAHETVMNEEQRLLHSMSVSYSFAQVEF